MLVFLTQFCELSTVPPSPFPVVQYIKTVCGWKGVEGVESCWRPFSAQEFNTLYLTRCSTCKIARPPQIKTQEGRGPQTNKHLPQSLFTGQTFQMTTFCFGVHIVNQGFWGLSKMTRAFALYTLYTMHLRVRASLWAQCMRQIRANEAPVMDQNLTRSLALLQL